MKKLIALALTVLLVGCATPAPEVRYVTEARPKVTAEAPPTYAIEGSTSVDPGVLNKLQAASMVQCIDYAGRLKVLLEGNNNEKPKGGE